MGYEHYWKQKRNFTTEEWDAIRSDFTRLQVNLPEFSESAGGYYKDEPLEIVGPEGKLIVARGDGTVIGAEICDAYKIAFNGGGGELTKIDPKHRPYYELSCEGFELTKNFSALNYSCKTERKPYDLIVCAVLVSAKIHAGDAITITSDGRQEDWKPALELVKNVLVPTWDKLTRARFVKGYLLSDWLDYAAKVQKIGRKRKKILEQERT
jgi:hypothetical protein